MPGVDFPIPLADRYRDICARPDFYKGKQVIGELYIRRLTKKSLLASDAPMSLARFSIDRRQKAVRNVSLLKDDFVLVKAKVAGVTTDTRIAGYPETFVILEPVMKLAVSPKSFNDLAGNAVPVPPSGEINDERMFRNVLREANTSYKGRMVYWNTIVYRVRGGKVYLIGPPMTDIKVVVPLSGKLKKLGPARNDRILLKAKVLGSGTTNTFGQVGGLYLKLASPVSIKLERPKGIF